MNSTFLPVTSIQELQSRLPHMPSYQAQAKANREASLKEAALRNPPFVRLSVEMIKARQQKNS